MRHFLCNVCACVFLICMTYVVVCKCFIGITNSMNKSWHKFLYQISLQTHWIHASEFALSGRHPWRHCPKCCHCVFDACSNAAPVDSVTLETTAYEAIDRPGHFEFNHDKPDEEYTITCKVRGGKHNDVRRMVRLHYNVQFIRDKYNNMQSTILRYSTFAN